MKIKGKTKHFYTPLAVGNHLRSWGVSNSQITELDWWQETQLGSLKFVCTPAQHFSGRGLNNNQSTLWSSWVITSKNEAKKIMPIHWAGFKLALHEWTDPIIRVEAKAAELNIKVIAPQIGQEIMVKDSVSTYANWWQNI